MNRASCLLVLSFLVGATGLAQTTTAAISGKTAPGTVVVLEPAYCPFDQVCVTTGAPIASVITRAEANGTFRLAGVSRGWWLLHLFSYVDGYQGIDQFSEAAPPGVLTGRMDGVASAKEIAFSANGDLELSNLPPPIPISRLLLTMVDATGARPIKSPNGTPVSQKWSGSFHCEIVVSGSKAGLLLDAFSGDQRAVFVKSQPFDIIITGDGYQTWSAHIVPTQGATDTIVATMQRLDARDSGH